MSLAQYRTRSVTGIIDATFGFYRDNFATVVTLAVLVLAPAAIIKAIVPADWQRTMGYIGNLLVPLAQGAIAAIVAAAVERGERLDVASALRSTSGRTGSLIAVQIASGLMLVIGLILLVVPGVIAIIWTAVAIPVVMIERLGYSKAIERSRALVRGRWRAVLGTLMLAWGVSLLLIVGFGVVVGILGVSDSAGGLAVDIMLAIVLPVPAIAMTLLYYDLRVRTESADLDAMVSALPTGAPTG